jgi:purine-binding chemotaxis protein CheW
MSEPMETNTDRVSEGNLSAACPSSASTAAERPNDGTPASPAPAGPPAQPAVPGPTGAGRTPGAHPAAQAGQFLTFALGQEEYGVEILKIQEIKGFSSVTPLPNAPHYVRGVMNLRGTIVPIVDLRKKFGLPEVDYTQFTVIVVVQVRGQTMGFIVDAVSDVLTVAGKDIQPTPDLHGQVDTSFLRGLAAVKDLAGTGGQAKAGQRLIILLDIDKVLTTAETIAATQALAAAASQN